MEVVSVVFISSSEVKKSAVDKDEALSNSTLPSVFWPKFVVMVLRS